MTNTIKRVVMAQPVLVSRPWTFVYHDLPKPHSDPAWGDVTPCGYVHEWVTMTEDVASCLGRECRGCAAERTRAERVRERRMRLILDRLATESMNRRAEAKALDKRAT